jgi:hypothetical protein
MAGDGIRWVQVRGGVLAKKRKKLRRMAAAVEAPRLDKVTQQQTLMALLDIIVWALRQILVLLRSARD